MKSTKWFGLVIMLLVLTTLNRVNAQEPTPIARGTQLPFQRGMSVLLYGNDSNMEANTVGFFDDLDNRELGVNSLIFTFPIFQDGRESTVLYTDEIETPSVENIRIFIREAHQRGYSIWLKPIIDDGRTGTWRGAIAPGGSFQDWALDAWFASYGAILHEYAILAEQEQAVGLIIGTEMESMDKPDARYTNRWNALIGNLRSVYSGNLSYAKNWTPVDTVQMPGFIQNLDILMIDAFFDLRELQDNASSLEISRSWQQWLGYLQAYYEMVSIPVMFAEVGVVPRVGAFRQPWNGDIQTRFDPSVQERYYQGTCWFLQQNGSKFGFNGAFWWTAGFYDYFENQRTRAMEQGIITFSFYDMPAEDVVRWCNRSWGAEASAG